jgi:predicted cation transporter
MADDALLPFLRKAKEQGVPDESLAGVLRQNGWSERRIYRALSDYYAETLNVPIPSRPGSVENARDAFLYLLNFITLGFWTVALWQIWDDLVKRWFPDELSLSTGSSLREDIAWQIAIIVVTFPVFVVIHTLLQRELTRRPELYYSPIRRWLTYIALVLSAITIVIDAALTIQAWILGHLTTHFILDTLALLLIGGGIFAYYLLTIDPPKPRNP